MRMEASRHRVPVLREFRFQADVILMEIRFDSQGGFHYNPKGDRISHLPLIINRYGITEKAESEEYGQ